MERKFVDLLPCQLPPLTVNFNPGHVTSQGWKTENCATPEVQLYSRYRRTKLSQLLACLAVVGWFAASLKEVGWRNTLYALAKDEYSGDGQERRAKGSIFPLSPVERVIFSDSARAKQPSGYSLPHVGENES